MKNKIVVHKGVSAGVAALFKDVARKLSKVSPIPKEIVLHVVPAPVVGFKESKAVGFGVFAEREQDTVLAVGGKYSKLMALNGVSRKVWLECLPGVIAHEWAHAEQWRDGRPLVHRGIHKRVRELLKAINAKDDGQ